VPHWLEKLLDATVAALVALFAPLVTIMGSTTLLVVCDLITGLLKARKRGEEITSYGIKKTVAKLGVYLTVIILAHITELYLTQGAIPVLNVVTSIIGITELKSCVENINILSGGNVLDVVMRAISKHVPTDKK
jgi:phage-related holin